MEFTLLWAALTAFVAAWLMLRWDQSRNLIPEELSRPFDRLLSAALVGLFAGRVAAMLDAGVNPLLNPAQLIFVRGGVSTGVASLSAILFLGFSVRRRLWRHMDALAATILAGLAGWHAGCLWRGQCLGTPSDLPWAVALPGSTITRHPTEIYAALGFAVGAIALSMLRARVDMRPGIASGLALTWAGAVRVLTEQVRPALGSGPVGWYAAGIVAGLLLVLLASIRRLEPAD